jgi:hypothetical protein
VRAKDGDESHRHTVTLPKRTEPEASLREASWFSVALSERPVSVRLRSSRGRPLRGRTRVDLRRPDPARTEPKNWDSTRVARHVFWLKVGPKTNRSKVGSNVPQKSRPERRKPNETGKVSRRIDRKPRSPFPQNHYLNMEQFLKFEQFLK